MLPEPREESHEPLNAPVGGAGAPGSVRVLESKTTEREMQGESPPCLLLPPCACRFSLPASVGESHGKALAENQAGREGEEDKGTVDAGRTRRDPRARAELGTEQWAQHAAGFSRWAGQQPTGHSQKLLKGWRGGTPRCPRGQKVKSTAHEGGGSEPHHQLSVESVCVGVNLRSNWPQTPTGKSQAPTGLGRAAPTLPTSQRGGNTLRGPTASHTARPIGTWTRHQLR